MRGRGERREGKEAIEEELDMTDILRSFQPYLFLSLSPSYTSTHTHTLTHTHTVTGVPLDKSQQTISCKKKRKKYQLITLVIASVYMFTGPTER